MNREQVTSTEQAGPIATDGGWGLRQPGLVTGQGGKNEVKAFNWDVGAKTNDIGTRVESGPDIDYSYEPFAIQDLPSRKGPRPATLRGPLHIQCNGHGDPQHLDELTTAVLRWPYVESDLPNFNASNTIPSQVRGDRRRVQFRSFY